MARANLSISSDILNAFLGAHENRSIRYIQIGINDESLVLYRVVESSEDSLSDFVDLLPSNLNEKEACLVVFRLKDDIDVTSPWLLIAWVPDGCRVRDKMLYSSSREDLKRSLGIGHFLSEYAANSKDDFSMEALKSHLERDNERIFSSSELLLKEEKALAHIESVSTKAAAMSLLSMESSSDMDLYFSSFSSNSTNWIEISIANEKLSVVNNLNLEESHFVTRLCLEEPRFYLLRRTSDGSSDVWFVYFCPENASIKAKMTASSFKASVISTITQKNITIDKTVEIRDPDDLRDQLWPQAASDSTHGSAAASVSHAKPLRPGRGRAKVTKFVADE